MAKKKLIIIGAAAVLLLGGGAGVYFSGMLGGGNAEDAAIEAALEAPPPPPEKDTVFYELPDIVVNLNSRGKRKGSFLKIKINLELADESEIETVEKMLPRIIDNLQIYLRELRVEDIQGSEGLYRLREELLHRVNAAAQPADVNEVLFAEMLMQ